ncbi:hypothetical protein [Citrobacter koseri]|uniref:hypothetical protein n=1 Tax=Citrobacter koseri TaxID=545 RepID=UPI0035245B60
MNRELIAAYLNGEVKTLTNSEQKELARIALASLEADSDSNSHPAPVPLSNDRLHRISDILRKAAAQRDGGNLGYAMSDAVKAIDELLDVRKAEPVAFINGAWTLVYYRPPKESGLKIGDKLYTAPPAPLAIDERAAFNAWNNEDNLPIAGVGAKNAAWLAWQARARLGSPTAPVVPATLPCAVELKPGLIIGKGCKTETLLTALQRRADYYAEIDAMTPEERAEHDANIEAFKAMLPQPVPDERKAFEAFMDNRFGDTIDQSRAKNGDQGYMAWDMVVAWIVWQGRAAMLNGGKS